jgi:hypothetical protein
MTSATSSSCTSPAIDPRAASKGGDVHADNRALAAVLAGTATRAVPASGRLAQP